MAPKRKREQPTQPVINISDDEEEEQVVAAEQEDDEVNEIYTDEEDDFDEDEEDEDDSDSFDRDDSLGKPVTLYVARWPNGDFSMTSAHSLANAAEIFDELADPGAAIISQYRGPLFFDFTHKDKPFENVLEIFDSKVQAFADSERKSLLFQNYKSWFEKQENFDITIKYMDSSTGKSGSVKAHRIFLCTYSKYFRKYFSEFPKKTEIEIGKTLSFITTAHVQSFLDAMYTGSCQEENLKFSFELAQLGVKLGCDQVFFIACKNILREIRFEFDSKEIVGLLNSIYKKSSYDLLFKALCNRAHESLATLKTLGLNEDICKILTNWKESNSHWIWNEEAPLAHDFILSSSTNSVEDGWTMWDKLRATVYPKSHKLKKKQAKFKEAFEQELREGYDQRTKSKTDNPQFATIMDRADISNMDIIRSWMNMAGGI